MKNHLILTLMLSGLLMGCGESNESNEEKRDCRHAEDACAEGFQCLAISTTDFECRRIQDDQSGVSSGGTDDDVIETYDDVTEIVKNLDGYTLKVTHTTSSNEQLTRAGHVVNYTFENGQIFGDGSRFDALTENWSWNFETETLSLDFGNVGVMKYVLSNFEANKNFIRGDCQWDVIESPQGNWGGLCEFEANFFLGNGEAGSEAGANAGAEAGANAGAETEVNPRIPACTPNCPDLGFVNINGGSFMMGSSDGRDNEQPIHMVTVESFEMMRTEVTVGQYRACVETGPCSLPETRINYCNWNESGREDHPINCVDWDQAVEFAEWVGARLPTEAEWEYAARGEGRDVVYPWGNDEPNSSYAVYSANSTATVCSKQAGNTPQELCDIAGNIWEWTEDTHHSDYNGAPADGTAWTSGGSSRRVYRGGCFALNASYLRVAFRYDAPSYIHSDRIGFRIVR